MRHVRSLGLAAVALFLLAACSDLPTMNTPTPDLAATFQVQAECGTYDNPCLLPPVYSDPVEPGCPWCYSGPCEESLPGSPETMGAEGCNSGGTTDPGDGGSGGSGGGTGPGDGEVPPCDVSDPNCIPAYPPEGIDQEFWNRLNATERRMCWANRVECGQVFVAANAASNWAAQQEPVGPHNGPQDAMRHAYWNARMTKSMGATRAKAWADAHEESSTNAAETRMDLHNNAVGRQVGQTWSDVGEGVWHARNNGQLCLWVGQC